MIISNRISNRFVAMPIAALLALTGGGCFKDSVAAGYYAAAPDDGGMDAPTIPSGDDDDASAPGALPDGGGEDVALPVDAAPAGPCDLTGRWLITTREVATAIGAVEAAHTWRYYELTQSGSNVTVSKGLDCGADVRGVSAVAANVDYPKTWPAMMANHRDTGRTGTSKPTSAGCDVAFEKRYEVSGATESFYADPSHPMPTSSEQASGSTPGWEDWDNDGHPGFTMNVTGLATGQLYIAVRTWSVWSGSIAAQAKTFTLADDWNTEQDVLGYNGSDLLTQAASGVKDGDATQHFSVFARLGATQATGDDAAICAAVRSLAPTLTPSASN